MTRNTLFALATALAVASACGSPPDGSSGQSDNTLSADAGSTTNSVDSGTIVDAGDPSTDPTDAGMPPCSTSLVPEDDAPEGLHLHCIVQQDWADVVTTRRAFKQSCFFEGDSPTGGGGVSAFIVNNGVVVQGVEHSGNKWIFHDPANGDCECTEQ